VLVRVPTIAQFAGLLLSPRRAGDIDRLLQQRQANAGSATSVCLSVASQSSMETVERIELGFGMEASFDLSHAVL